MGCCVSKTDELEKCTLENTPKWEMRGRHRARVLSVYDGDTFTVAMSPVPGAAPRAFQIRVKGVDTPEMKQPRSDPDRVEKKASAVRAREATLALCPVGSYVTLDCHGSEKFGRVLASVTTASGTDLTRYLIDSGFGVAYDGGTKGV